MRGRPLAHVLVIALGACGCPSATPGVHRDQLVFVGGDGTVLALGLVRHTAGSGEAKGWLGVGEGWGTPVYDRFPIAPRRIGDLEASVRAWSTARRGSVRASWTEDEGSARLRLRTRTSRLFLDAEEETALGTTRDPEGVSAYTVRRAHLGVAGVDRDGWLVEEHTPEDSPRRPFVDYGGLAFVTVVRPDGDLVIAKRSIGRRGYDFALSRRGGVVRRTDRVRVKVDGSVVVASGGDTVELAIRDRDASDGVAPGNRPVRYEVLLLGRAGQWSGVAFTISQPR